jgi:ABC-type phosphate transport system auxiliary subunit
VGVTEYTAVPAVVPVAVNVWVIEEPLPAAAPDTLVGITVQANVVPETTLVKAIELAVPEQIV